MATTADFSTDPYWWEETPRPRLEEAPLPKSVDVAIVGSGYTGLNAAIQTARAGRSTLVFDAGDAGFGCSTRNGGQISTSIKPTYGELARLHGPEVARALHMEGRNALAWIGRFIAEEGIEARFKVVGRFHAAHSPRHFEKLARSVENQTPGLEVPCHVVPPAEQHRELGTDYYHGGVVYEAHAVLDPGRYHQGLLDRAIAAGATISAHNAVTRVARDDNGFVVTSKRGMVRARDVLIATNGYTGTATPWLRRRIIPIGSYIIATEALPKEVMDRLMPTQRIVSDTRKVVYYYRTSPDRTRILFGGRVTNGEADMATSGRLLKRELVRLFPELKDVGFTHSWSGTVAYTFDTLAHTGVREGIHYAMGYCGSGVSMASYLGLRAGQRIAGNPEGRTAFETPAFRTRPLYTGNPWFLSAAVAWYRFCDERGW
jgi:Glycine/D-amino acid oxidases (deaminating)